LGQDFKNLSFIVYGTPEISPLATNANKDLIKMPGSLRSNPAESHPSCNRRSKLLNPSTDRFIAYIDATFGKQFLDVPKTQREAKIEPDGPLDD